MINIRSLRGSVWRYLSGENLPLFRLFFSRRLAAQRVNFRSAEIIKNPADGRVKFISIQQQTSTSRGYRRGSVTGDCDSLMSGYALRYKRLGWPILPYTISTRTNCVLTQYSR